MSAEQIPESAIELQVPPDSEILRRRAQEVPLDEIINPETQAIIDTMFRVAKGRQGDPQTRTLVGLAAPQIGIGTRIVLIGMDAVGAGEQPELKVFINPIYQATSPELEEGREGCFSTGCVCGIVRRAKWVTVRAYDRDGNEFTERLEGFPARIAQHEMDHLDGIRFPDRIIDDSKLHWVEPDQFGDYRTNWQQWPSNCTRQRWLDIKFGNSSAN